MVQEDRIKPKLIVITGATATGKTAAAIRLAQALGGEVVGCDSMQVYRGMDVGTGKVTPLEAGGIRHHMIDVVDPDEEYSVGIYKQGAEACIREIGLRNKLPILTGGTGLYIHALLSDMNFAQAGQSPEIRCQLQAELARGGEQLLYQRLREVDPAAASRIHAHDTKRVIRALEIYLATGKPKSQAVSSRSQSPYDYMLFVLGYDERERLYRKIDARVEDMFAKGLEQEALKLYRYKDSQSMQAIGYKELIAYFDGLCTIREAKALVQRNSRHYAKRQMTFFRGLPYDRIEIDVERQSIETHMGTIEQFLAKK